MKSRGMAEGRDQGCREYPLKISKGPHRKNTGEKAA
jgi:hypothetical protein